MLIGLVIGLFVLLLSLGGIARFITDYLWFDSAGYGSVWRRVWGAQIVLAVIFISLFAAMCLINLWLAERLAPPLRSDSPEDEAVRRFREMIGPRWGLVRLGVTALFALSIGANAASLWRPWLLFTNAVDFGQPDPQFGRDIGFYVFRMPFLTALADWLFTALLVIFVLTAAMHYLAGGIRIQDVEERFTPQVKAHLSFLLGAMALVRAWTYWLDRYALAYSSDGKFSGLSHTDVAARLPVLNLLILISLLSVVLFVVNISRKGWGLPAVAVGLWALVTVVMGSIYPVAVQRLSVDPDETTKEASYVARNIEATKAAYGLAGIEQDVFEYEESLTGADLQGSADNLQTIPLLAPDITAKTFRLQQVERSFFQFDQRKVDVDRYMINGELTPVLIGARELNSDDIPEAGWESEVLSFTHGNGVAVAPANNVVDSLPTFLIGDVPMDNQIAEDMPIDQPRVYFGETMSGYAIVDTDRDEVDWLEGGTRVPHNYEGHGGVEAGGFLRRSMFALRFRSIDPLISDFVRDDSRFVWNRNVRARADKIAPFLEFDHNPYPVVAQGRIKWVIDSYTTTANYPYSQMRTNTGLDGTSELNRRYNYVRASVKTVVDAYNGTVEFFVVDESDPIAAAWSKAFPGVFQPASAMPEDLVDNLRYPEDLFTVQTNMWAVYHIDIDETADLLEGSDEWAVAQDPGGVEGPEDATTFNNQGVASSSEKRVPPYYSLLRLPGENEQDFVVFRSFVPFSAQDTVKEMQAFMVGVSEFHDGGYGRLVTYEIDNKQGDVEAPAPALVASQITSQDDISKELSLLTPEDLGSSVEFGDLIVLPVENSFVYVRPLYVIATNTEQPNLEWVIVSYSDTVVMCHSLTQAIDALFGVGVRGLQDSNDPKCHGDLSLTGQRVTLNTDGSIEPIIVGDGPAADEALRLLDAADDALIAGDLGRYQQLVDRARQVLTQAVDE